MANNEEMAKLQEENIRLKKENGELMKELELHYHHHYQDVVERFKICQWCWKKIGTKRDGDAWYCAKCNEHHINLNGMTSDSIKKLAGVPTQTKPTKPTKQMSKKMRCKHLLHFDAHIGTKMKLI